MQNLNGGTNIFMCINSRWCSEKPKKIPPKLTALQCLGGAEVDIFCSDHHFKQTQRGFSSAVVAFQMLCPFGFFEFLLNAIF